MHPRHDVPARTGSAGGVPVDPRVAERKRFFRDHKVPERREVRVEDFGGPREAVESVRAAMESYSKRFGRGR